MAQPRSDPQAATAVRLAGLLAAPPPALDLGLGQPLEHVLRSCLIAMRLGAAFGASAAELRTIYYGTLLRSVGCTSDSHETAAIAGGDDLEFTRSVAPLVMGDAEELTGHVMRYGDGRPERAGALPTPQAVLETAHVVMRAHCEVATMIARRLGLDAALQQALWHGFARWDGGGFPGEVAGDEIPLASRIAILARDTE